MNRKEEYWALIRELGDTPPALEGAVERARTRVRRARAGRWLGIPVASLGGAAAAFVLLVNCSMPFAMACRRVPVVRELAEAVAFEPSLKAALENDYIQSAGQTQTQNGVTMSVEYFIMDETALNVFYTLRSEGETALETSPTLLDAAGGRLSGYSAYTSFPGGRNEQDYLMSSFYFKGLTVPDSLRLHFDVWDTNRPKENGLQTEAPAAVSTGPRPNDEPARPGVLAAFDFDLTVDPGRIAPTRTTKVDRWVELDGQRLYLDTLAVDPTRLSLTLSQDPANTAELHSLDCYAVDELGNRYGRPSVTYGAGEEIQLESPYFSGSKHLTLYIERASWLDKDRTAFTLDLATGQADWLPDGLLVNRVERGKNNVCLAFQNDDQHALFSGRYYDPEGGEHSFDGDSTSATDVNGDGYCEKHVEYRVLKDYPWDAVTIGLSANRETEFPQPVSIPIR